jgi:hypothetical protein
MAVKSKVRSRVELVAEPEWIVKATAAGRELGLTLSAYIRLSVNRMMNDNQLTEQFRKPSKSK